MNDPAQDDAAARNRLMFISLARLSGVAMVALGVLVINGTVDWPAIMGYALVAVGAIETIIIPQILVKKWRSDKK